MKYRRGGPPSTLRTRATPLVSSRLLVSLGQADTNNPRFVEASTSIVASRLESIGVPLAVRTVNSNWLPGDGHGGSSVRAGFCNDKSKQAPKDVLRTYTRPSATAGAVQHLLTSPL